MRIVTLAAALALGLAGCGGSGGPTVAELVSSTAERTAALKSFHFALDTADTPARIGDLTLTSAEGDLVVPDRLRAEVAGTFSGTPLSSTLVAIGDDAWIKNPFTGGWQKLSGSANPLAFFDPAKGVLAVIKGAKELEKTGEEGDAYRLEGTVSARDVTAILGNEPSDREAHVVLLVGKEDRLLRRLELHGAVSAGEPADAVRTVELSRFDEAVTIEPPA